MAPLRFGSPAARPFLHLIRLLMIVMLVDAGGCARRMERVTWHPGEGSTLDGKPRWIEAHMHDGSVYVLENWRVDAADSTVVGEGRLLDASRALVRFGAFRVPVDSVAIFEANVVEQHVIGVVLVPMMVSAALTIYCLTNTKACFGSCPTFYVRDPEPRLLAEGFSASVAPSLEATDVDVLHGVDAAPGPFTLEMRNEALETHAVRHADVLVLPRGGAPAVLADGDGGFVQARRLMALRRATATEGDCTATLRAHDGIERFSLADSFDLAAREVVDLTFDTAPPDAPLGLVLVSRQTLMTTFLLYQTLAWMGHEVGDFIARLERMDPATRRQLGAPGGQLGPIEVLVPDDTGNWVLAGTTSETGPLATDVRVVRLPETARNVSRVRLRLTRGYWRLDAVQLAVLGKEVTPLRVPPESVWRKAAEHMQVDPTALAALRDPERHLATFPGDTYELRYALPDAAADADLFLDSRGYYLEWMRDTWMLEQDPARAARMFLDPAGTLRDLAPAFKAVEADMESSFWSSRYAQ